jgi:hypothetical protein
MSGSQVHQTRRLATCAFRLLQAQFEAVRAADRVATQSLQHTRWAAYAYSRTTLGTSPYCLARHSGTGPALDNQARTPGVEDASSRYPSDKVQTAAAILRQVSVRKLTERLNDEATHRVSMPLAELLSMIKETGITGEAEAMELVHSLHGSGMIILHGQRVFLNADEVCTPQASPVELAQQSLLPFGLWQLHADDVPPMLPASPVASKRSANVHLVLSVALRSLHHLRSVCTS